MTVLIHSEFGSIGVAAIQFVTLARSGVFATCMSEQKRQNLANVVGFNVSHLLDASSSDLIEHFFMVMQDRGVNVVVNISSADLCQDLWGTCADLNCFVQIRWNDILNAGK